MYRISNCMMLVQVKYNIITSIFITDDVYDLYNDAFALLTTCIYTAASCPVESNTGIDKHPY